MEIEQWPLTAAATQALLALPAHGAKRGSAPPPPGDAVKLALKELLLRGAYRIEIEKRRFGKQRIKLIPTQIPELPRPLADFDELLRPHAPGEIGAVVKAARKANSKLVADAGELFLGELSERGLAEERREKSLGLFPVARWRRTASGDAWAASAAEHVARLEALEGGGTDDASAARVAAEAGAVAVMVPAALPELARNGRRSRQGPAVSMPPFIYVGDGGTAFDPAAGADGLFDSALGDIDASFDAVGGALDSVATSIDSAVDSGVDAGGGGSSGGGGDGGGGGGGDGGGGGSS